MKKGFVKIGNIYKLQDVSSVAPLEKGIYVLAGDERGNLFLIEKDDKEFVFNFKVYGIERAFIERVKKTYYSTKGNMGILLNGIQGTGKTITGEIIANELNLPIILVTSKFPGANEFLASFEQDIVIFIDEYEKVYKGSISEDDYDYEEEANKSNGDSSLLSLMSGIHTSNFRRFFILTTNKSWINENMLNRPGRLMFLKNFSDLKREQIEEIIDDVLVNKEFKDAIFTYMKPLKIITVDIVKAIVNLVNIFNAPPEVACQDLNVEFKDECYDMYLLQGKENRESLIEERISFASARAFLTKGPFNNKVISANSGTAYQLAQQPKDDGIYVVYKDYDSSAKMKITLKKSQNIHSSFAF